MGLMPFLCGAQIQYAIDYVDSWDHLRLVIYVSGYAPNPDDYRTWQADTEGDFTMEVRQCEEYILLDEDSFGSPLTTTAAEDISYVGVLQTPSEPYGTMLVERDKFGNVIYCLGTEGFTDTPREYTVEVNFTPSACDITLFEDFALDDGHVGRAEMRLNSTWYDESSENINPWARY